ncbi:ald, partial [Drosophila busckii]
PRRRSQMTLIDSDSEEEDARSSHNLNCAILNDSFVLSPMHDITGSTTNSLPAASLKPSESNLSLLSRFGKMGIDCSSNSTAVSTNISPPKQTNQKPATTNKQAPASLHALAKKRESLDSETPLRPAKVAAFKSQAKPEIDFITPQVQSLRTDGGTNKLRNDPANEFRSQKVLFQTPMTVSRGAPFNSDSISFSLCDTINESPDTPAQPTPKPALPSGKTKKSLEGAFQQVLEVDKPAAVAAPAAPMAVVAAMPAPAAVPGSKGNSNVLQIKNQEYLILKKLGCGGSSSVYLAKRRDTGKEFALKVVDLQADPLVVEGYLNETKLLEKLQGNECVVSLYDYQLLRQESKLYMVMEKGDCDLNKILQGFTTNLPLYNLMNILYQMLQAVNYIHQHGVIHSDLKPANFLMINGRLKLIDFGIASNIAVDSTSIIKFSQAGTFNYISPEALTDISTGTSPMRGGNQPKIKISTKSDVWSLGCILYLLMYQKTPFGHIRNINAKMNAIANPSSSIEYPALPIYYPPMLIH